MKEEKQNGRSEIYNDYDANSQEAKDQYLSQITAVIRFVQFKIDKEIAYRKEKSLELMRDLEEDWEETNLLGYSSEITGMPKSHNNTTSVEERAVLGALEIEDSFKRYTDGSGLELPLGDLSVNEINAIRNRVYKKIDIDYPTYPIVFREIMRIIHGVSSTMAVLLLEKKYMEGLSWKAIEKELDISESKAYRLWHEALNEIRIPEVQRTRRWVRR